MSHSLLIKLIKIAGIVICATIFISFTTIIYFNRLDFTKSPNPLPIDLGVRDFCYSMRGEKYDFVFWLFRIITEFGNIYVVIGLLVLVLILSKMDYRFFIMTFGIIIAILINLCLKALYVRTRPMAEMQWVYEASTSFPSGHSTAAGFMYSFIFYLTYHTKIKKALKMTIYFACISLIILIMVSRLILGVHYISDVLTGAATGIMVSCFCMLSFRFCLNKSILTRGLLDFNARKKDK